MDYTALTEYEFEKAFKQNFMSLLLYANTIVNDVEQSREITQNVFYKLWMKKENISINYSLLSYLYKSVHNECVNYLKHKKTAAIYIKQNSQQAIMSEERTVENELKKKIKDAIKNLPQQCSIVFCMSRFEEMKYKEIAAKLDISVKAVEKHITKALKILRVELQEFIPLLIMLLFFK